MPRLAFNKNITLLSLTVYLIISMVGCKANPDSPSGETVLSSSKSVTKEFNFFHNPFIQDDTSNISLESEIPDITLISRFYLGPRIVKSYSFSVLELDTSLIENATISFQTNEINMSWSTLAEFNNRGWEIQWADSGGNYTTIGFVNGSGTTSQPHYYSYTSNTIFSSPCFFRFKQIHFDGSFEYPFVSKIEYNAIDSVKNIFSIQADNGVIVYEGEIAPDSGYSKNAIQYIPNELVYFRNLNNHYGKFRLTSFNFLSEPVLNLDEDNKMINYKLSYELFIQTNGERSF